MKQWKKSLFSFTSNLQTDYNLKLDFKKSWPIYRKKMVNARHQTPQGQLVAEPGTPLWNILVGNVNMTYRYPKVKCSIQYSRRISRAEISGELRICTLQLDVQAFYYVSIFNNIVLLSHGHVKPNLQMNVNPDDIRQVHTVCVSDIKHSVIGYRRLSLIALTSWP